MTTTDPGGSASTSGRGFVQSLLDKVSSRVVGAILMVGIVVLAATTGYAVFSGRSVDFWGLKIGEGTDKGDKTTIEGSARTKQSAACEDELANERKRTREAERRLAEAITRADLPQKWRDGMGKSDVLPILSADGGESCDDDDTLECLYAKIENRIGKSGGFIDVKHAKNDIVKMVQKALQSVDAFEGDIDGDGTHAWSALLTFQRRKGIRSNEDAFEGKFGTKTLARIRKLHDQIVHEA
jgi:hypothetical protein